MNPAYANNAYGQPPPPQTYGGTEGAAYGQPQSSFGYQQQPQYGYQQPPPQQPQYQQQYQQPPPQQYQQPAYGLQPQYSDAGAGYAQQPPLTVDGYAYSSASPAACAAPPPIPQQQQTGGHQPPPGAQQPPIEGIPLYPNDAEAAAGCPNPTAKGKFVVQGCKDVWAAILFVLLTIAVIVWGLYNYATYFDWDLSNGNSHGLVVDENVDGSANSGDINSSLLAMWGGIGIAAGIVCGIVSLALFHCFPKASIIVANIIMIGLCIGIAIWTWITGTWAAAIILTVCALLRALMFWLGRHLIPFSAALLKESTSIIKSYPMLILNNVIWVLLMSGWGLLLMGCVYPTIRKTWYEDDPSAGALFGAYLFAAFASYWTSQVVFNVCHVVTSGVTATWYFFGPTNMPSNPTLHSIKRAMTTSFGSICFGSLLVAIIRLVRALFNMLANSSRDQNCFVGLCFCIIDCILGCIESLLRMFNHFAFVFVAMYGCGYLEAARMTTRHIRSSVWLPLFANNLVTSTLYIFALSCAVIMGIIAYFASSGDVGDNQWESIVVAVMAGACLSGTMYLFFNAVDSGVTAFQVCLAEEPHVLPSTNPDFYAALNGHLTSYGERHAAEAEGGRSRQQQQTRA